MKWRIAKWLVYLAILGAVAYGIWSSIAHVAGKHYFRKGMSQVEADPAAARKSFGMAARLRPKEAQYQGWLGRACLRQKDYLSAAHHLKRAAELKPENLGFWMDLGEASMQANSPVGAREAYEKALEIRPDARSAMEGLVEAATAMGDPAAAMDPLRSLWEASPDDTDIAAQLARALADSGQNDEALKVSGDALGRLGKQLGKLPDLQGGQRTEDWVTACDLLVAQGDVYRAKGRWADAIATYLRCLPIVNAHEGALAGLREVPSDVIRCIDEGFRGPAFSRKGSRLAFYSDGLFVVDLPAGEPRKVADIEGWRWQATPAWSPDGQWLCFTNGKGLRLVKADGTGERALVKEWPAMPQLQKLGIPSAKPQKWFVIHRSPVWSPNGKRIAFWAHADHGESITYTVDVASGKAASSHATTGQMPRYFAAHPPAWTADGTALIGPLAYSRSAAKEVGLTVWSGAGQVKRQIPLPIKLDAFGSTDNALGGIRNVAWSPDKKAVAVTARVSGQIKLCLVDAQGKRGKVAAGKLLGPGMWLDAKRYWFLKESGTNPIDAQVAPHISDPHGTVLPAKERFPIVPVGMHVLSGDRRWLAMCGREFGEKGMWVVDLRKLNDE